MIDHKCSKEKEIDKLAATINGNGKQGLVTTVSKLVDQVCYIVDSTKGIKADLKELLQFQTHVETREDVVREYELKLDVLEQKKLVNKRWRIGLTVTTILSLIGFVFMFIISK